MWLWTSGKLLFIEIVLARTRKFSVNFHEVRRANKTPNFLETSAFTYSPGRSFAASCRWGQIVTLTVHYSPSHASNFAASYGFVSHNNTAFRKRPFIDHVRKALRGWPSNVQASVFLSFSSTHQSENYKSKFSICCKEIMLYGNRALSQRSRFSHWFGCTFSSKYRSTHCASHERSSTKQECVTQVCGRCAMLPHCRVLFTIRSLFWITFTSFLWSNARAYARGGVAISQHFADLSSTKHV